MTSNFTPEEVADMRERLRKLVRVYLDECSPDFWPGVANQSEQQQRYWAKQQAQLTLRQVNTLQALLRKLPREPKESAGDETAAIVEDAKRRGAELRARVKGTLQ